ncbi:hypothetical protein AMAG_06822 [Allomyces macrogynus ATCC 38327]|uniref:Uncharacterized protein n=1 Tax=Allomyces macrogynus (strain ATCC 38327) TaxID=578462 RepID=A0A0L0SF48_ALLM3|nr:hypothetical protein AMAG_06822 [Allomyces macrogynus ATCC 38327]|eukprot:KNE61067.1 hypothetical protein AMAG_06822 [Allomyces macrogynus ATCC 38327]
MWPIRRRRACRRTRRRTAARWSRPSMRLRPLRWLSAARWPIGRRRPTWILPMRSRRRGMSEGRARMLEQGEVSRVYVSIDDEGSYFFWLPDELSARARCKCCWLLRQASRPESALSVGRGEERASMLLLFCRADRSGCLILAICAPACHFALL